MISLTEAEQFEYPEQEIDKPLKHITLSEADSIESYKFKPFEYERGAVTKFATGVVDTIRDMQDLPEQLSIFGNRLSYGYGGYFGDTEEETERKKQNLLTAERNLAASQRERYRFTSGKEQESIAYGVGSGAVSYGTMLISSGLAGGVAKAIGMGAKAVGAAAEVGGLGAMGVMELAGQVQDKTPTKDGQIDAEAMTPEWARRVTNGTVIYTALSGLTEKYVGFGRQLKMWEKPISWGNSFTSNILTGIKSGVKSGLSEGLTEGIQDLEATGIGLLDGSVRLADLPARIQQAWKSAIIGGIIGTSAGTAVAIKSGRNVRKQLRDMVYPVVGNMDEAQSIADAIYQSGTDEMTKVMSIELELSSELKNKHGKVWNSMLAAVSREMKASGAFNHYTEDEFAQMANTASKHFADNLLAEANFRGTTLDAILKDTDIAWDKGLRLKRNINVYDALKNPEMIPPETKLKRTSLIQYLRSRGGVQDVGGDLKSRGAIKEAPGLISKKGMGLDDAALSAWEQGYFPEFVERSTINDLLNAIDDELRGKKRYNVEEEATFEDELANLAEGLDRMGIDWRNMQPAEIEQAVEEYPELQRLEKELQVYDEFEYDIEANMVGSVTGTDGYRIIVKDISYENFRKAVDEVSNPVSEDVFNKIKEALLNYTGTVEDIIDKVGEELTDEMNALSMSNSDFMEVVDYVTDIYNERLGMQLYQTAYHGTGELELEGGEFRLDKAGTGEGHAAHGHGVYATVEYDVADKKYRKMIADAKYGEQTDFFLEDKLLDEYNKQERIASKSKSQKEWDKLSLLENMLTEHEEIPVLESGEFSEDIVDWYNSKIRDKVINKNRKQGQVFELDVPENTYLLNEQLKYENQPEIVKKALDKIFNSADDSYPNKELVLKKYKDRDGGSLYRLVAEVEYYNKHKKLEGVLADDSDAYRLASEALNRKGVKGITYDGREDGRSFVIFNPKDVKIIQNFYQRGAKPKGKTTITPDEYIIKLLEGADESTLAHELAHYWLDTMFNYVRSGRASESYMNRWNAIADYLKIDPNQTTLTRPQQEKFASSYEAYLTRGQLPSAPIQSAFDDYDKWLQRVYNDYNQITYAAGKTAKSSKRKKVRLTDTAIKFFQSMTTGTLDAPMLAPKDTGVRVEDLRASMPTDMAAAPATVVDTTRVVNITEGEKGVSAVFKREGMKNADRIVDELGVSYNKINLEEQAIKATEWVRNNLEEARKVVDGAAAPEGIIDTAIFIAYENEMLRIGNNAEYTRALKIHSQVQSQRGQAIAAERIATNNMTTPAYWLEKVINNREQRVAERLFKGDVKKLRNLITDETKKAAKEVLGKSQAEQAEYLNKLAEKLRKEYSIDTFYQTPEEEITKDNAMNVIHNFLEDAFGITVSQEEADTLINKAEQLKKVFENTLDESGNPSVESFRILSEMNRTVESMSPSHIMTVMSSIYGRSAMLASIKSPVLNILSNAENFATEGTIRRFTIGADTSVDRKAIEDYMRYAWEVYKSSGFIVSGMQDIKDEIVTLGETRPTTQGKGRLRKIAQTSENIVFKYLMGAPDSVAKDMNFVDTADLLATKIAKEEGAQDISKRATEIFKDAILINPLTEQGKQVREQAIEQAHTATFTNNSMISEFSLKARQWLNMIGGNKFKLGDVVMPFVKTPANVQMMGLEYGFGSLYTLYKVNEIIKNPRSEVSKRAIKSAYRNGLGLLLATLIASMFEPDDYIPEFDNATQKDRDLAKAKNAPFNSIKIGNKWVSLDYFGILGIPLVGIMNARKGRNLIEGITGYVKSGIAQGMKIPGIKEGLAIWDSLSRTAAYSTTPKKAFEMVSNALLDQVRARTIPAIVNDVAKVMDKYERDTSGSVLDKVQASIPFLRERLPERYTISGKPLETEGLSVLLFGGRVKTAEEGKLVSEIDKLAEKQEQPSISDVTKYGDLRLLSPEKKIKVRKEFFREYSKEARKVINSSGYRAKSAEDRKKALNKVRKSVVAELKEKYAKDIKREKRRR